jgi:FkbM family methyltransferase
MHTIRLPNGKEIACLDRLTALYCYHEIYTGNDYLRRGIAIHPGDVIFDVGANIGHFTRYAAEHRPDLRIYAFEPVPPIFEALTANTRELEAEVHLFDAGLAERPGSARFYYYPRVSADSAMVPVDWPRKRAMTLAHYRQYRSSLPDRLVPPFLRPLYLDLIRSFMYKPRRVECRTVRLSDVIREQRIERIDLLKIDAENAETRVLAGIDGEHWPLIRQISMEVHEHIRGGEGLLGRLREQIESRGFNVYTDEEGTFSPVGVHMLYARRSGGNSGGRTD